MNSPLPLPDELRVEESNPYRRRQKVIGIRRGASRASRIMTAGALGLLLSLALPLGAYWGSRRVMASRLFLFQPDQDVKLTGNHVVSLDDVLNALGYGDDAESPATSLFRVDLTQERRRVDAIPWVESATLARVFPNLLMVAITERTPAAYAQVNGRIELVDQNGVFLQMLRKAPLDFPVLYGLDTAASAEDRKAMIVRYEQFLSGTRDQMHGSVWSISEVDLSDPDDLRILLVQGKVTILAHFGSSNYAERFKTFATVAPEALISNPKIDSMDLRYPGEVVVDPAGQRASLADGPDAATPPAKQVRRARTRLRR
ncbi:MAG: cell division protein FtsQ/DivIB [Terriglobia bacterium]